MRFLFLILVLGIDVWAADGSIGSAQKYPALVTGKVEITIKSKSQGEITELKAVEGKSVKKGEMLAQLDDRQEKIEVTIAESEAKMAKEDFRKTTKLTKFVSRDELQQKEAAHLKKKAQFDLKSLELANTQVVAPVDGVVTRSYFEIGETVSTGDKVFDLVQLDELILIANVPARDVHKFPMDSEIPFTIDRVKTKFKAKVFFVSPIIDASSDTVRIKLIANNPVENKTYAIKPGMMANLSVD